MIRYDLMKSTVEVNDVKKIKPGCTFFENIEQGKDPSPELIKSFESKEAALEELKKYETEIERYSYGMTYFYVTEWFVEECDYDEDGDVFELGDIWKFSEMKPFEEDEDED